MGIVTAKQLHLETSRILNDLEQGNPFTITRKGRVIGRLTPLGPAKSNDWGEIMSEVWQAQKHVKKSEQTPNPVLEERQRRRR
jgi:antitoxin (DNA-binding transcriptional repressor) of toxin-antitoxin stability system